MSGRGNGRSRNGGRRNHRSNNSGPNKSRNEPKKTKIEDYQYRIGSSKDASEYEETTAFIINHLKGTCAYGDDIAKTLSDLQEMNPEFWEPEEPEDGASKYQDMMYQEKIKVYLLRSETYRANLKKAHAIVWERCTKGLQSKIKGRRDYKGKIEECPIELLKAIKEHALNCSDNKYAPIVGIDVLKNLLSCKQMNGESLQDYTTRFRNNRDVYETQWGRPMFMPKMVNGIEGFEAMDDSEQEIHIQKASKQILAYLYLSNADQSKYGSLVTNLNTNYSLGQDLYPKTITEANEVLTNHKFDATYKNNQKKDTKEKALKEDDSELPLTFAQMENKCYCCGKKGHKSTNCRDKSKPRAEWFCNKFQHPDSTFAQPTSSDASVVSSVAPTSVPATPSISATPTWNGAHIQFFQNQEIMKEWILLDNQSSVSIFCNPAMVSNIRSAGGETMKLFTNGGVLETNLKADLPNWGEVWFNPQAITNIFSYAEMRDRYKITYDQEEDSFTVHMPDKPACFRRMASKLYVFNWNPKVSLVTTVSDNAAFYTTRQFERAKLARELYHALGTPSINDFKSIIRMNTINNNPVVTEDIVLAEKIFGPDIGCLKGKTTRKKPLPVVEDRIDIPKELIMAQREVTLSMDGMNVNGISFLTTISHNICYRTAQWLPDKTMASYRDKLIEVLQVYAAGGFKVTQIRCDNEFRTLSEPIGREFNLRFNYANAQEHVPAAERNNRVIKERVRATFHRLPYTHLPRTMIKVLVMDSAKKLNFFPAKNGVSPYYSPRMILHQKNIEYGKHCQFAFGTYVQAHNEPTILNSNAPRTLDCIYLRYLDNDQGGHQLLHLPTNRMITRRNITVIPISQAVIEQVHALAALEQVPPGLKITNKTGHIMYDTAQIAGVDYEEYEDNSDEDDSEEESENEYDENDPDDNSYDSQSQEAAEDPEENNEEEESNSSSDDDDDDEDNNDDDIVQTTQRTTRSGRIVNLPQRYAMVHSEMKEVNYDLEDARPLAAIMCQIREKVQTNEYQFAQTFSLKQGIRKFGDRAKDAAKGELQQLHDRVVFEPVDVNTLDPAEKSNAMESLLFLTEKKDGTIKGRACANGSIQREYVSRDDAASPTAATESIFITGIIDAKEERDVMTADIPNAFVQTEIDNKSFGQRVIMKIRGALVDILLEINPSVYEPYVIYEGKSKVIYMLMNMALYGMIFSSLLYYKKFRRDIESIGFKVNQYDPCVANKTVDGKQHTITWHVDDIKSSHVNPKVNDDFQEWLKEKYASDKIGKNQGEKRKAT